MQGAALYSVMPSISYYFLFLGDYNYTPIWILGREPFCDWLIGRVDLMGFFFLFFVGAPSNVVLKKLLLF